MSSATAPRMTSDAVLMALLETLKKKYIDKLNEFKFTHMLLLLLDVATAHPVSSEKSPAPQLTCPSHFKLDGIHFSCILVDLSTLGIHGQ